MDHPPIKTYRFTGEAFTEGVEAHELDGIGVHIYSPEKTLADCFKFRNKIGLDTASLTSVYISDIHKHGSI